MRLKDTGLTSQDIKDKVNKYMIETYERFDFLAERAKDMYMYDENGEEYLDFYAGIAAHNDCQPCILLCNGLYCREILWHCGYYRRLHCRYRSLYAARRRLCGAPGRHQQLCDFCADFLCQHRFKDRHQRTDAGDSAVQCLLRSRCSAGKNHRLRTGGQSLPFQLGRLS